jgi:hypothetical protein
MQEEGWEVSTLHRACMEGSGLLLSFVLGISLIYPMWAMPLVLSSCYLLVVLLEHVILDCRACCGAYYDVLNIMF